MKTERRDTRSGRGLRRRVAARLGAGWWLITRDAAGRIEVLTVGGGEALAVFSFEEEAEIFLRFGELDGGGWRTRESGVGELVSVLSGPRKYVGRVALDPMPVMLAATVELASLSRERFLERVLGRGLLPAS